MGLPNQTFAQFVTGMTNAWGASIGITPAFQPGDVLLAIFEAVASQDVFLQAQAQLANDVARVQTSTGGDVDTFMAQFGFTRLAATLPEGPLTMSAPSPASVQVLIYPGSVVTTVGGAIQYQVVPDTNQAAWNATLNAYVLNVSQTSISVTMQSLNAGASYNVQANQLTVLTSPIPGISTVTNPSAISNGVNAESDAAFEARFVLWLNSLSKATQNAILTAVSAVQLGLMINAVENVNPTGNLAYGQFIVVIDNGTGAPPSSLINAVQAAVTSTRGFTILGTAMAVQPANPLIGITIGIAAGYQKASVESAVQVAIAAYTPPIAGTLYISSIEGIALAVPGVTSIEPGSTTINGIAANLPMGVTQAARMTIGNIDVGFY